MTGDGARRAKPEVNVVRGDITRQSVDAIVNAANRALRGGGGVDGAIHAAGGPEILEDCIARFPEGLQTGDAGWTTAGRLPAQWVIHTVGPNHRAGETDRALLESCYRRSLEVADELGARSVAFPLISAGVYGWPKDDAIDAALTAIWSADTRVESVSLVAFDTATSEAMRLRQFRGTTPFRLLEGVAELHARGFEQVRINPYVGATGMSWRLEIFQAVDIDRSMPYADYRRGATVLGYTSAAGEEFLDATVDAMTDAATVADLILEAMPDLRSQPRRDPVYAAWYRYLMRLVAEGAALPIAYSDHSDDAEGWEIGWGSRIFIERPPAPPRL